MVFYTNIGISTWELTTLSHLFKVAKKNVKIHEHNSKFLEWCLYLILEKNNMQYNKGTTFEVSKNFHG